MKLQLNSPARPRPFERRASIPVRVYHSGRSAVVLVSELEDVVAQDWESAKNSSFVKELEGSGLAPNAVVLLRSGTLPRIGATIDGGSVKTQFAGRRGYLREELMAWIVNRLCEVLYFSPRDFDAREDWARHGVDSAVALELVADLEDYLELRLPQALAECRSPNELVSIAASKLLDCSDKLPWWRSAWVTTEIV